MFAWGLDRYGQMGAGGRSTKVGVAAQAFDCELVQVPGLNWAALSQIGACSGHTRAARCFEASAPGRVCAFCSRVMLTLRWQATA